MGSTDTDDRFLRQLAVALVDHPRATLQELAAAIGVSKATLYRFCRTRDQLVDRLMTYSTDVMNRAMLDARLESAPPAEALQQLIANHLSHSELTVFLMHYMKPDQLQLCHQDDVWRAYERAVDALFLRGQHEGVFRIDIAAATLTETLLATIVGLVDAEHRGRVARAGLAALIEQIFLQGAAARNDAAIAAHPKKPAKKATAR